MTLTPPHDVSDTAGPSLRVIAVGLAGRERDLRRDDVELIRAHNGLEALGELGMPIDESSPSRTVILLDAHAIASHEIPDLADALRRLDREVRVVALDGRGEDLDDPARDALDAVLGPDLDPDQLARLFEPTPPEAPPTPAPETPPAPAPEPGAQEPAPPAAVEPPPPGTPASIVLQAILSGRDVVMAYVDHLGQGDWGDRTTYVDVREGIPRPPEDRSRAVVDVAMRGKRFGWLIGPREAEPALRQAAGELALAVAVQRQQEQLRASAFTDHLTGAWNRRYFDRSLERSILDARDRRRDLTLLLFDIDDFKHYNDAYGHAAGDEILVETVRLLRAVTRPDDEVCRIGGDEFAVVFYEPEGPREPGSTPPRSIFSIAHRFRQQICAHKFPKLGEQAKGRLTISGGLATYPWDGHDAESLIEHADRLLMQSKREGKNVICLGPGAMRVCGPDGGPQGGAARSEGDGL